ncbi:hypothetical protein EYF80_049994 [Liparis tanakae]|uniref:Uncharacterized protein n=1 Tax=Liparis tanakae TaxID=230148 RepID=A0A4Z2FGF0_9TELE|nr:hypothetical protein EYF80_049994 [Liparis tanakae]
MSDGREADRKARKDPSSSGDRNIKPASSANRLHWFAFFSLNWRNLSGLFTFWGSHWYVRVQARTAEKPFTKMSVSENE